MAIPSAGLPSTNIRSLRRRHVFAVTRSCAFWSHFVHTCRTRCSIREEGVCADAASDGTAAVRRALLASWQLGGFLDGLPVAECAAPIPFGHFFMYA